MSAPARPSRRSMCATVQEFTAATSAQLAQPSVVATASAPPAATATRRRARARYRYAPAHAARPHRQPQPRLRLSAARAAVQDLRGRLLRRACREPRRYAKAGRGHLVSRLCAARDVDHVGGSGGSLRSCCPFSWIRASQRDWPTKISCHEIALPGQALTPPGMEPIHVPNGLTVTEARG